MHFETKFKILTVVLCFSEIRSEEYYVNSIDDVFYLMHGDLSKIDFSDINLETNFTNKQTESEPELIEIEELIFKNNSGHSFDTAEFNGISRLLMNNSRRKYIHFGGWNDPDDIYFYKQPMEHVKKKMIVDSCFQWLIHARYKIYAALRQREMVRKDKRYKLGYLFNRLRRINYDQKKLMNIALHKDKDYYTLDFISNLRITQKVIRLDVDVKDTINLLKAVYAEPDPLDFGKKKN